MSGGVTWEQLLTAAGLLSGFSGLMGAFLWVKWNSARNTERIVKAERALGLVEGRVDRIEKKLAYQAGRDGHDVTKTSEFTR